MSAYDYDYDDAPRRHRSTRTRDREPEYVEETTYIQRGPGRPSTDLVYRGREESIEDIPRDFPPQAEYRRTRVRDDYGPPRRARSARRRDEDYYEDEYSDYAGPVAAGAAGYAAGRRRRRDRRYRDDDYISDDYAESTRERRKSKITETLEDLGLGGVVGAIAGKAASSRSRSRGGRSRHGSFESDRSTRSRARSQSRGDGAKKWQQAATAALLTGAVEAWRSRKEPGGITGPKGRRIATAALGAAGIDAFLDKNPHEKSKRHVIESVIGGLAANRLANGPRSRSGSRGRSLTRDDDLDEDGRPRSRSRFSLRSLSRGRLGRSQSRGPDGERRGSTLKDIAALGGIAAAGKAIYDRVRSKSRNRDRDRSRSDSEDSYVPSRRQRYQRDRGAPPDAYNNNNDDRVARPRGRSEEGGERKRASSSDSVSTTDLENQRKRTRGKELLTAGLATVATIHAAHGVYSSMVASEKRHKLVMEGEMSPEEARKRKSKNMLQDAAAVGIAALGIKSAFSEWKEMNEQRHSVKELEEKRRKRRKAREKREREQRQNGYGQPPNAYAYPVPPAAYPAPVYADGNPYASAAGIPPPPMGTPQNRY